MNKRESTEKTALHAIKELLFLFISWYFSLFVTKQQQNNQRQQPHQTKTTKITTIISTNDSQQEKLSATKSPG